MPVPVFPVQQRSSSLDGWNILFLGDGFSANDEELFYHIVYDVVRRLFRYIKPFNLKGVEDRFNIFSAFTHSLESGISCTESIDSSGRINPNAFDELKDKVSQFGLAYTLDPSLGDLVISPKTGFESAILDFIADLYHPGEPSNQTAIPVCWDKSKASSLCKDAGLVVVLINDDVYAANTLEHTQYGVFAVAIGINPGGDHFALISCADDPSYTIHYDHDPEVAKKPHNQIKYNQIIQIIAHELGHSFFNLGDEYVDTTPSLDPLYQKGGLNILYHNEVVDPVTKFYTNIKWNKDKNIITDIFDYIKNNGPLSHSLTNDPDYCPENPAVNDSIKKIIKRELLPYRIIGLYEGAATKPSGVYRPAGFCLMRAIPETTKIEKCRIKGEPHFCYVCQKEIISKIDSNLLKRLGPTPGTPK